MTQRTLETETEIQSSILSALRQLPGVWLPMPTGRGKVKGKKGFIKFGTKGMADIMGLLPNGRTLFLEVKTATGVQSEDQIAFQERMKELGHEYAVVRSVDEALDFVTEAGR